MPGFIIVLVCVAGAIIWGLYAGRKRRGEMGVLADQLGLHFNPERDYSIPRTYDFLDRLNKGSDRYAQNVIYGTYREHEVVAFDFHYRTASHSSNGGNRSNHHHFSFFILKLDQQVPELTIARETVFSKIAQAVGYDDIDFDSPEFSKRFVVRSKDEAFTRAFCSAEMIEYLLSQDDLNIEADRNLLAIGFKRRLKVDELRSRLDQLIEIRERMP